MLVQLHWQNMANRKETEFIAQCNTEEVKDVMAWASEICERRRGEIPEGWTPLVCTEENEHFMWAVPKEG